MNKDMKNFTMRKIGYTAGVYGCTGEYFAVQVNEGEGVKSFVFHGLYGADYRVAGELKAQGYAEKYVPSVYGKLTRNDIPKKAVYDEHSAIELLKGEFKDWTG